MSEPRAGPPSKAPFPTTRWSRVVAAGDPAEPGARAALAELCAAYWYPLYAFVRRRGHTPTRPPTWPRSTSPPAGHADILAARRPRAGRFRSFLMAACGHLLADRRDHDRGREARRRPGAPCPSTPATPRAATRRAGRDA